MAKANYAAWQIDSGAFSEQWTDIKKLQFFAKYAILAPSGHNTQPWHFSHDKQALLLQANKDRSLPYSGLQANEPLVSLGSCLGVLRLAAKGFGCTLKIDYVLTKKVVARITISGKITADARLLDAITHRVSNRSLYTDELIPEKILSSITKNDLAGVSVHVISKKNAIALLADKTVEATLRVMGDKKFRGELSKWVRNNMTRQHDGMPGFVQEIPTPPSMLGKHIIKRIDISKDQAKKDSKRMLHTPHVVVITVTDSSKTALLNAGSLYSQICVLAAGHDIDTSGLGTAVIDPQTAKDVVVSLKLPGQPIGIIRLGKATKRARHAPRWPLAKVSS